VSAPAAVRAPTPDQIARTRLTERLAIVDELHDDIAHDLATASIHLGLLDPEGRGRAAGAPGVAQVACRRSLDGVRRARRRLRDGAGESDGLARTADERPRLEALAAACGATLVPASEAPDRAAASAGLRLTAARIAEALLRVTAGRSAVVEIADRPDAVTVSAVSALPVEGWGLPDLDLTRVAERVRWFDGTFAVEPSALGSRATAELPW
jgi:signal transduction histidine kinase